MSQENVEVVRRFIDHYNETGEPLSELIDPDVTWVVDPDAFLAGTYPGPEGFTTILGRMEEVSATYASRWMIWSTQATRS